MCVLSRVCVYFLSVSLRRLGGLVGTRISVGLGGPGAATVPGGGPPAGGGLGLKSVLQKWLEQHWTTTLELEALQKSSTFSSELLKHFLWIMVCVRSLVFL